MDRHSTARTSVACMPCREQHLKCDSARPTCSRCRHLSKPCWYTESRRSRRGRSAAVRTQTSVMTIQATCPPTTSNAPFLASCQLLSAPSSHSPASALDSVSERDFDITLLDIYYQHFHPSHPFVLPRKAFLWRLSADAESLNLRQLATVMQYVASFYRAPISLHREFSGIIDHGTIDGFTVQATLLLALAKSMCDDKAGSEDLLSRAIAQATGLGMNKPEFSDVVSLTDPMLAESWRRTWWMIYMVDANFSVIRRDFNQRLADQEAELDLPCDENSYASMTLPETRLTLRDYQSREYALEERCCSTFAYLIDASSIFVSCLRASTQYETAEEAEVICSDWEANISGWFLMLPLRLREPTALPASGDQLIFQAHMMMYTALAFLHRPLSTLQYDIAEGRSSCLPPPPPLDSGTTVAMILNHQTHLEKLIQALRKQNQCLIQLPMHVAQLSPFVICMVACGTIAHLVACKFALDANEAGVARSRIRVSLGTLKHYEDIWPKARKIVTELKSVANDILQTKAACQPVADEQLDQEADGMSSGLFDRTWMYSLEDIET